MTVRWRVHDLGLGKHRPNGTEQRRYFIAGINDIDNHWTPQHRFTLAVARKIEDWRNEWEDLRLRTLGQ